MKKTTIALLGLLLLLAVPATVQGQFEGMLNEGGFTITGYFGPGGTVTIPTKLDALTVTGIAAGAFGFGFGVTNVIIPASVTNIGDGAFSYCLSLTAITVSAQNLSYSSTNGVLFNQNQTTLVEYPDDLGGGYTIPGTVTNVEADGFQACLKLTNVTIPNGVLTIGNEAFEDCPMLLSVTIPASVTSIGESAFLLCSGLTNASMTNGIVNIGAEAFQDCGLTSVTIPASVTNIGSGAFSSCNSLTAIAMAAPNAFYSSTNGVLFNQSQATLIQYPCGLGGSYSVPDTVTSIGVDAFLGCHLTNIAIPENVTSIGAAAFESSGLESIVIPDSVTNIAEQAFSECFKLTELTVAPGNSFYSSESNVLFDVSQATLIQYPNGLVGTTYSIPGTVTRIGDYAFLGCGLTSVTISVAVRSIGSAAFQGCDLTNVTIPAGVTNIGEYAFTCQNLTNVTLEDGVTSVGEDAFYDSGLISITIPASVTNIGLFAFVDCTSLNNVCFAGNAPITDPSAFASDNAAVYYLQGTTGWSVFSANTGVPAVLWNPIIQTSGASFGVSNNQFGFTITNGSTTNIPIAVEACTNLASQVWIAITNVTLTNSLYFSDPQWTNYPARYYGIGFP